MQFLLLNYVLLCDPSELLCGVDDFKTQLAEALEGRRQAVI